METNPIRNLSGLIFYVADPSRSAAFYRALGVPLELSSHGHVGEHLEGSLGGVHFAMWDAKKGHASSPLVPVFRTSSLEAAMAHAASLGAERLHAPIDLGEGKTVVTFRDPEGRAFRFIEIAGDPA
ncbi:MAG: VOC family protein [Polyangiaceae bacterium]